MSRIIVSLSSNSYRRGIDEYHNESRSSGSSDSSSDSNSDGGNTSNE